jgi:hypothetical protein
MASPKPLKAQAWILFNKLAPPAFRKVTIKAHVTDAGLTHLAHLEQLEALSIIGTDATPNGVAKLRRALPECKIDYR